MTVNINSVKASKVRAVGNRVLVTDMHFGEQKTASGLIIKNDNGTTRGIYPRWAKVHAKGPDNKDDYEVGHWILIEHGRWTRGIAVELSGEPIELRMVDAECILGYSIEKPADSVVIGYEYDDKPASIRAEDFGAN
jgi:co-chaperonin GroES (HSP10)